MARAGPGGGALAPRALLLQALVLGGAVALGVLLVHDTLANLARQGIATGFGYLEREASFAIGSTFIPYSPADSYGRALLVGLVNTLVVAVLGVAAATVIGTAIGIARLSGNWLVRTLARLYVEVLRDVPLLLQLILWWNVLLAATPEPQQAWQPLPHVFLSNRGLAFPLPLWSPVYPGMAAAAVMALAIGGLVLRRRRRRGGRLAGLALLAAGAVFLLGGAPWRLALPVPGRFNFSGGATVTPEFLALVWGLSIYTAAFIAEIVRSGIAGVGRGQAEAAAALGLSRGQALRLVILPQALRLILPPLISEYLALTKNSSLAIAIGYPDLTAITYTTLNQTGQAVEAIALMMALYLALSLATALALNWANARAALVER